MDKKHFIDSQKMMAIVFTLVLLGSFIKPLRTTEYFGFIGYQHYIFTISFFMMFLIYLKNKSIIHFDMLVINFALSLLISVSSIYIVSGKTAAIGIFARYLLPLTFYFFFRYIRVEYLHFERLLLGMLLIAGLFLICESYSLFNNLNYFDFERYWKEESGVAQRKHGAVDFFYWKVLRSRGVTGYPQPTGAFFGAFFVYYLHNLFFSSLDSRKKISTILVMAFSGIAMFLCGSGTAKVVAIIFLFSFVICRLRLSIWLLIPLVPLSVLFIAISVGLDSIPIYIEGFFGKTIDLYLVALTQIDIGWFLQSIWGIGKTSYGGYLRLHTEISWINVFIEIGLCGAILFLLILINFFNLYTRNRSQCFPDEVKSVTMIVFFLFLCSSHYESFFVYPSNMLAFAIIGWATQTWLKHEIDSN